MSNLSTFAVPPIYLRGKVRIRILHEEEPSYPWPRYVLRYCDDEEDGRNWVWFGVNERDASIDGSKEYAYIEANREIKEPTIDVEFTKDGETKVLKLKNEVTKWPHYG